MHGGTPASAEDFASFPLFVVFKPLYTNGLYAVDLFFTLSGFIFYWLYSRPISAGAVTSLNFFVLRFSRLYPLNFVTLLLVGLLQYLYFSREGVFFVYQSNDAYHFFLNLLLMPSVGLETSYSFNGPVWSISIEVVLYALFFLASRRVSTRPLLLAAISLVGFAIFYGVYPPIGRGLGSFFLGGCVWHAYDYLIRKGLGVIAARAFLGIVGCLWLASFAGSYFDLLSPAIAGRLGKRFLVLILFPLTVLSLALWESTGGTVWRRLTVIGEVSYSVYLWHFPLQLAFALAIGTGALRTSIVSSPLTLVLFLLATACVSSVSYRYLEMPAQAAIRRWFKSDRTPPTPVRAR